MRSPLYFLFLFAALCLLFAPAPSAMGAEPLLLNGSDGSYWGLSKLDVAAKAPGNVKEEKTMGGFTLLVYTGAVNGIPVETAYTLKGDKCWKITITPEAGEKNVILPLFQSTVAELTKRLGTPSEAKELEGISNSASWDEGETTAYVYIDFDGGKAALKIACESAALVKSIWGSRAK